MRTMVRALISADDLRIMLYTAEPGTEDAAHLELAIVLGAPDLPTWTWKHGYLACGPGALLPL
jgi:hypothetical protein